MFSDPFAVKALALLLLGGIRLVAGLSPVIFSNALNSMGRRRVEVTTSLALCVAGGVLLASTMLHMIPKVRDNFAYLESRMAFPMAEFVVCCGLFIAYIIEECVGSVTRPVGVRSTEAEIRINGKVAPTNVVECTSVRREGNARHVLVLSALSLHSILEGLALGLQTGPRSTWTLFAAISGHASVVLFCVGLDLVSEGLPEYQIVIFVIVLAVSSPLGGVAGLLATVDDERAHASAVAALQGLSAGAVMFITFFEVLEKEKKKGGFIRFFCVVIGFTFMAGLQILEDTNHTGTNQKLPYQRSLRRERTVLPIAGWLLVRTSRVNPQQNGHPNFGFPPRSVAVCSDSSDALYGIFPGLFEEDKQVTWVNPFEGIWSAMESRERFKKGLDSM